MIASVIVILTGNMNNLIEYYGPNICVTLVYGPNKYLLVNISVKKLYKYILVRQPFPFSTVY